ncbi:MAG: M28 family metallopeptidase [Halobacteriales archaeon]|nr:M28 family metallopeptidase [Halobacteriales archaeon]
MTDDLAAALGRAWRDDTPWQVLSDLAELGDRMAGHPGERAAAERVTEAFEAAGLEAVETQAFGIQRWTRGDARLAVTAPVERAFPALALPYSPAGSLEAELVDVGHGTPEEIEAAALDGRVALVSTTTPSDYGRFVHRMESYGHVHEAGGAGFVFHNHVPGQLPPTGSLRFDREGELPGVGVSHETGQWLVEYAEKGGTVELAVDASTDPGESVNVHGTLGPETDDEVVVLAHHDGHDVAEGALDNAAGVAVLVGAARVLSALELDCRVRFASVGAEEIGLLGAEALADSLDLGSVRSVVNLDGIGRFRDLKAFTHGSDAALEAVEALAEATDQPVTIEEAPHPYSDHWPFLRRGVPALQLHADSGERGRGWGHTQADTRDKVDARNLRTHSMLAALLVRDLTRRELPRVDPERLVDRLGEAGLEPGMRAADIWPR